MSSLRILNFSTLYKNMNSLAVFEKQMLLFNNFSLLNVSVKLSFQDLFFALICFYYFIW